MPARLHSLTEGERYATFSTVGGENGERGSMAGPDRRIDLRFGAFACSVQGFDDPDAALAKVLRQVVQALTQAPQLKTGALFDMKTLGRLERQLAEGGGGSARAVPGLVVTRFPDAAPPGPDGAASGPRPARSAPSGADELNLFRPPRSDEGTDLEPEDRVGSNPTANVFARDDGAVSADRSCLDLTPYRHQPRPADNGTERPASARSAAEVARAGEARTIPDLLAAAAAWLTLEQGKDSFDPLTVLSVLDRLDGDWPTSFEIRLKAFERLVRHGRLIPVHPEVGADSDRFRLGEGERRRWERAS